MRDRTPFRYKYVSVSTHWAVSFCIVDLALKTLSKQGLTPLSAAVFVNPRPCLGQLEFEGSCQEYVCTCRACAHRIVASANEILDAIESCLQNAAHSTRMIARAQTKRAKSASCPHRTPTPTPLCSPRHFLMSSLFFVSVHHSAFRHHQGPPPNAGPAVSVGVGGRQQPA